MLNEKVLLWILSYTAAIVSRDPDPNEVASIAVQEFEAFYKSLDDKDDTNGN
jgi:hypothetical protein